MKIVADENVDKQIVEHLRKKGNEVYYICEQTRGIRDEDVLVESLSTEAILITADKDFGELVFRQQLPHSGILLIRLMGLDPNAKSELVAGVFEEHGEELRGQFSVLSNRALRVRRQP